MQCSSRVLECRAFPTAAAKSQSQKLTLLPPIPQTLFLLQSCSAPKSVSDYGSPVLLVMAAPQSFAACPQTAAALNVSPPAAANNSGHASPTDTDGDEHPKVRKESSNWKSGVDRNRLIPQSMILPYPTGHSISGLNRTMSGIYTRAARRVIFLARGEAICGRLSGRGS